MDPLTSVYIKVGSGVVGTAKGVVSAAETVGSGKQIKDKRYLIWFMRLVHREIIIIFYKSFLNIVFVLAFFMFFFCQVMKIFHIKNTKLTDPKMFRVKIKSALKTSNLNFFFLP